MWHKFYKKMSVLCTAIAVATTIFSSSALVYGASENSSIYEDVVGEVSDTKSIRTRGNFLNYGTVMMTKVSSTRVRITGITAAHRICDKLGMDLYLYKSPTEDGYYAFHRVFPGEEENDSLYGRTLEVIVPSGYWYQLGGSHIAIVGNDGESINTMTDGLYVN